MKKVKVWFNGTGHRADISNFEAGECREIPENVARELVGCRLARYTKEVISKADERKAAEEEAKALEEAKAAEEDDPDGEKSGLLDGRQVPQMEPKEKDTPTKRGGKGK